jgi:hypothetical protein
MGRAFGGPDIRLVFCGERGNATASKEPFIFLGTVRFDEVTAETDVSYVQRRGR